MDGRKEGEAKTKSLHFTSKRLWTIRGQLVVWMLSYVLFTVSDTCLGKTDGHMPHGNIFFTAAKRPPF